MKKMKRKILLITLTLVVLSITIPALATPTWFVQIQCEITDVQYEPISETELFIHVTFEGAAGGPGIKGGTVEGVDHLFIDSSGNANINVYYTVTDKDGDQISFYVYGASVLDKTGKYVLTGAIATVIDTIEYPTTDKFSGMVSYEFIDEGFITDFSDFPPGGHIHAKLYPIDTS